MSEFVLPELSEATKRIDDFMMATGYPSDHPLLQDWIAVKFALKDAAKNDFDQTKFKCTAIENVLKFYADKNTYNNIGYRCPEGMCCGPFMSDFSNVDGCISQVPGRRAREILGK